MFIASLISASLGTLAPSWPIFHSLTKGPIDMSYPPPLTFEYSIPVFIILKLSSLNLTGPIPAFSFSLLISVFSLFILTKFSISIIRLKALSNIYSSLLS